MFHCVMRSTLVLVAVLVLVAGCSRQVAEEPALDRDWFVGRVIYEINVAEFTEEGTLAAVIPHLDEIRSAGIRVIVLSPIHPGGGRAPGDPTPPHPYSVRDHLAIDPALGDLADFTRFSDAVHERGMALLVDMVLNHGSLDHAKRLGHPEYFAHDDHGHPRRKVGAWVSVVDFNHQSPGTRAYLQQVLKTWSARGVDGFRCLHAPLIPKEFWVETLAIARRNDPDLVFLAESRTPVHLEIGFDFILRPQYMEASDFAHLDDLSQPGLQDDMWMAAVDTLVEHRGLTFLEDRFGQRAACHFPWPRGQGYVAGLLTLPGTPVLYNGQEWGSDQPPRLFDPIPLDRTQANDDWSAVYRDLLTLREESEALRCGMTSRVEVEDHEILVFTRSTPRETVLVAVNLSNSAPRFTLSDDLTDRSWESWQEGAFSNDPGGISGSIRLEPCGWKVWRSRSINGKTIAPEASAS